AFMKRPPFHLALCAGCWLGIAGCQAPRAERVELQTPVAVRVKGTPLFVNGEFADGLTGWTVTNYANNGIIYPPAGIDDLRLGNEGQMRDLTRVVTGDAGSVVPNGLSEDATLRVPKFGNRVVVVNERGDSNNVNSLSQSM